MSGNEKTNGSNGGKAARIDATNALLGEFLKLNPESTVEELDGRHGKQISVVKPWNDSSIIITVPEDDSAALIDALNNLRLPNRFSAIYHNDRKDLEVIWTAYKLPSKVADIVGRKFSFRLKGGEHECEYAESSKRLLEIAKNFRPVGLGETASRNLQSLSMFTNEAHKESEFFKEVMGTPISFWVRNIEWNDDDILALAYHLNFYMRYYDNLSPTILIHSPSQESAANPQTRFMSGRFPKNISAREIDQNLLYLWEAARSGDSARRFMYYYRIIEYASSFYLEASARSAVRVALSVPNALDDLSGVTENVMLAIQKMKIDEYPKIEMMLKEILDAKLLWRELQLNLTAFTTETEFDGGCKIPAMFAIGSIESTFLPQGITIFARVIRDIRNGLSHGKETKSTGMIAPTTRNFERLEPWAAILAYVAGDVIVYREVI